ncbi:MAG TPA: hypothetical protein PKK10_04875 [Woeseiaceae bacterium]|nr:hypothetical protein [Woeseiaceae bacterium]
MNPRQLLREILYPARSLACVFAMLGFFALLLLAAYARLLGIWLAAIVVPALFRYLIIVAEQRANDREVEPPGIEFFSLGGNLWTLFPAIPLLVLVALIQGAAAWGIASQILLGLGFLAVFPAMMAVLVITHSPAQSLNPVAIYHLIREVGGSYLYAPLLIVVLAFVPDQLVVLPGWFRLLAGLYLAFAFYAVVGGLIREADLIDDLELPDPVLPDQADRASLSLRERRFALNHAYALISRGNRDGGLHHLASHIDSEPDPAAAWPWFLEQMLRWENPDPALYFAQRYLKYLLLHGESVKAVKLLLRCRLQNDEFRPFREDRDAAADAARVCGNNELAESLEKYR